MLENARQTVEKALTKYRQAAEAVSNEALVATDLNVDSAANEIGHVLEPLYRVSKGTAELYELLAQKPNNFDELSTLMESCVQLAAVRKEDESRSSELAKDFGRFFSGKETDWDAASKALKWTEEFLKTAGRHLNEKTLVHATNPQQNDEYRKRAADIEKTTNTFMHQLNGLKQRFNLADTDWVLRDSPLTKLVEWADDLDENVDEIPSWVEYQNAVRKFDDHLGPGTADAIRLLTERAEEVPGIVRHRIYAAWLEDIYADRPELREFSRIDHEKIRSRFRKLDESFPRAARQKVRERCFEAYPDQYSTPIQGGQNEHSHP